MTGTRGTRIEALDSLRGIAVGGILFANVLVFFGLFLRPPDMGAGLPGSAFDGIALFLLSVLVEGKFYSTFSLLFGIGFGLQLMKAGDAGVIRFKRRLRILLVIGALHAVFIWAGDILMLYALLGLTLPWFARKPDAQLLKWVAGLLALHTALYLIALLLWSIAGPATAVETGAATGEAAGIPPEIFERIAAVGTGNLADAFIGNLLFLAGRWMDLFATMRFPKVLGMFVLGLWLVRKGIVTAPADHVPVFRRWALIGLAIGLPANVLAAWAHTQWEYLPPSLGGLAGVAGQAIGFPLQAIGYSSVVLLMALAGARLARLFAPLGRMALTNYLMHSIICVVLSYGFGFGLWWRVSVTTTMAIAAGIVLVQIPLSAWWLSRFRFGPAEWVWRRLTYGAPLPMR